jgi:hypothetical protein
MRRNIAEARETQRREKAQRMAEQALFEREEFQRVLEWNQTQSAMDNAKIGEQVDIRKQRREELLVLSFSVLIN